LHSRPRDGALAPPASFNVASGALLDPTVHPVAGKSPTTTAGVGKYTQVAGALSRDMSKDSRLSEDLHAYRFSITVQYCTVI